MNDDITLQAAIDHLNEFVRLIKGLPREIQWTQFAIGSWKLRREWVMLRDGKKINSTGWEQLDEIKAIAEIHNQPSKNP